MFCFFFFQTPPLQAVGVGHLADLAAGVALWPLKPPLQAVGVGHLADLAAGVVLWPLKAPLQAGGVEHLADLADLDRAVVNFSKPPLQAGGVGHLADLADLGLVVGGRPLPAAAAAAVAVATRRSPLAARRPSDGDHLILPALDTPIKGTTSLPNVDFSKCFVEVDVVEMSMSGKEQRHRQIRTVS